MASRRTFVIVGSVGTGVLIGGGAMWLLWGRRITADIARLTRQIESLQRELARLQTALTNYLSANGPNPAARPASLTSAVASRTARHPVEGGDQGDGGSVGLSSTEEEEDIFEEAYDGPVPWLSGLSTTVLSRSAHDLSAPADSVSKGGKETSGELAELYVQVDKLLEGTDDDKREAFRTLGLREAEFSTECNFLWRLAKSTYFVSQIELDKERQRALVYASAEHAKKGLALDDNNSNAHKWYAITLGSLGDYESVKTKISNGYAFKTHIERAISLNPRDPTGHYLLGRWCFSVYMLSWVERKMAATLFAAPPSATVDEALDHFLEADRLNPGKWKENLLFIAKCWIQKRDYSTAVMWLDKANNLPSIGLDDQKVQVEVESLLKQYSSYRAS